VYSGEEKIIYYFKINREDLFRSKQKM